MGHMAPTGPGRTPDAATAAPAMVDINNHRAVYC